ncbi:NAD-dependent epimerase/dehydratase family protein [Sinorhizobium meliloti]|nr:NAD-dependent epimerase/dehydratase family protein [Sinorhizobium meliloti]
MSQRVILITGATGNLGQKLRRHFGQLGYPLKLLCLNKAADPEVYTCDLSTYDTDWATHFEGVDTVLHVAADPHPWASWQSVQTYNLDLLCNVLAAAQQNGVRRVVFASSNFVMAGERFRRSQLSVDLPPNPINAYGASKLAGERIGKMFADRYGMSFIAFRIGVCLREHGNRFGPWIPFGRWGQEMWVSDRDLCNAFERAVEDDKIGFGVFNLVSNNEGSRWDLTDLQRDLGYQPLDGARPSVGLVGMAKSAVAYFRDDFVPALLRKIPGRTW